MESPAPGLARGPAGERGCRRKSASGGRDTEESLTLGLEPRESAGLEGDISELLFAVEECKTEGCS